MFISGNSQAYAPQPGGWVVQSLRAAGEPTRLRILALLASGELAVGELAQALGQSQPRVSRHLKLLGEAGLIDRMHEGAWVFCRLARGPGGAMAERLVAAIDPADPIFALDRERLVEIRATREAAAAAYFAASAHDWERVRKRCLPEQDIDAAVLAAAGPGPFEFMVDAGAGVGRMMALFAPRVQRAEGFDVNRQMLAAARAALDDLPETKAGIQYGDIYAPPIAPRSADLVLVHLVLHYLTDPRRAIVEAARLLRPGGRLVIVDFSQHTVEFLRRDHAHRRLGFADGEVENWCGEAGIGPLTITTLAPDRADDDRLVVKIWAGDKAGLALASGRAA